MDGPAHFNDLSPEVAELLAILAEECGETVQRVGKILRHGLRVNPYTGVQNSSTLEDELADIYTIVYLLDQLKVISEDRIKERIQGKLLRLARPGMLHHGTMLARVPCADCGNQTRDQINHPTSSFGMCRDRQACQATSNITGLLP